jgi:hypothetical protein
MSEIDSKPRFEFLADSAEPGNKAGTARWVYTTERRGEEVEVIVRQQFDSFDAASAMNELIRVAFDAGCVRGERRVVNAVLAAVRPHA